MSLEQENTKNLSLETLSDTSKNTSQTTNIFDNNSDNNFVNKKRARFLSRLVFSPSYLKKNKKQFLVDYMWFFTHKKLFALEENNKNNTSNRDPWASMEYLWTSSKDLEKDLKTSFSTKKKIKKYLRKYTMDYLQTYHQEDSSRYAIRTLKQTQNAKLSKLFFQPWKKVSVLPTERQHWLNTTYSRYHNLRFKDRIDFFRTYLGQMIGGLYFKKANWRSYHPIPINKTYFKFQVSHTNGWWYENLVQKERNPRSAKRFILDRPKTAFQIHWTQQKLEPWKNILLFRRALYSGYGEDHRKENKFQPSDIKNYLRSKNPRREKRNRLYARANFLWNNFRQRYRIRADKFMRLKQVANKILSPFYGNLRSRQNNIIVKKSKKKKSKTLTFHEVILSHFENRLDVVVYRLNLAPSILWARRLIKAGLIFITPAQSSLFWESMYYRLKNLSFPLKLRDPKKLYTKTYWTYSQENWVEFKFLGQPKTKISYLLKPGDLIQCAAGTSLNNFKTQSGLYRKPVPAHLLVTKKRNYAWHWHLDKFKKQTFKSWEQSAQPVSLALFLHSPRYRDLDLKDRVKESFLRWAML